MSISLASHFLSFYLNHPGTGTHEHHRDLETESPLPLIEVGRDQLEFVVLVTDVEATVIG